MLQRAHQQPLRLSGSSSHGSLQAVILLLCSKHFRMCP